jgi:hypothetical protein
MRISGEIGVSQLQAAQLRLTLTVAADEATTISERRNRTSDVRQATVVMPAQKATAPRQIPINEKGFGRLPKP